MQLNSSLGYHSRYTLTAIYKSSKAVNVYLRILGLFMHLWTPSIIKHYVSGFFQMSTRMQGHDLVITPNVYTVIL